MATDREVLLDVPAHCPKGCRLQLWVEDQAFHIGAACDYCQDFLQGVLQDHYPNIKVEHGP